MQVIGSLLFNLIMWLSVLLYAPLALLTFPLPYRARYRFITGWARFAIGLGRVLCGLTYRVHDKQNLPTGPAIFLAKHQSTWETFAFPEVFPPYAYVLKRELMWIPLFGWSLALLRPIAIDRASGREALRQIVSQGTQRLRAGISVMLFPEGTRVAPGAARRWGIGGAVLGQQSGFPVVPVAHNAGCFWPRRSFLKRRGTIDVIIGPPISSVGRTAEEINRIAEAWVNSESARLEARANGAV